MVTKLERIAQLVRACGVLVREADRTDLQIDAKAGPANFVTAYDKLVQDRLRAGLKEILPEARFIGEEGSDDRYAPEGLFFIVDPIDGTTNFIKDYHYSSISVALVADGVAELAVVYNPYADELFSAVRGCGAVCNGKRLAVTSQPLANGIVIFGTSPYDAALAKRSFDLAYALFTQALDVRRSGSAALDLCAIAAGRAELFFELQLSPWDYAAGALIVQEAGGLVCDVKGAPLSYDHRCSVLAHGAGVNRDAIRGL